MFTVREKDIPHRIFTVLDVKIIDPLPYFLIYRGGSFIYVAAKDYELFVE